MVKKNFFVTTAIDYVNAKPHIGHAFEKILADALVRWAQLSDRDVWFLTGTDENAQKNAQAAKQAGIQTVVIPAKNEKDLTKVPEEIKQGLSIHPVDAAEKVLKIALELKKPEDFMKDRAFKVLDGESKSETAQVAN